MKVHPEMAYLLRKLARMEMLQHHLQKLLEALELEP